MKLFYKAVAGTAMAISVAATAVSPGVSFEEDPTHVVRKTVVSSKMRFIFAVGLEGTGHHYFVSVQDHLFRTNKHLAHLSGEKNVYHSFYTVHNSMARDIRHYNTELKTARDVMRRLAQRGAELQFPGTVMSLHSRDSYPMSEGPNKALKYVDLRFLAALAEEEGVDFRVLYLRRSVKDSIIANTVHRKFQMNLRNNGASTPEQKYMQYMQILFTDIAVLHSFIAELDPGFVVCHDYDRLGSVNQSVAIADVLAPNAEVAALVKTSFIDVAATIPASPNKSLPYLKAEVVAARLQRKLDTFESQICPPTLHE